MADDELAAWLWLLHTPGVGRGAARRLLARLGGPQQVLWASPAERRQAVDAETAERLSSPPDGHDVRLAATLAWRQAAPQRRVMVLGDGDYPPLLLNTADPPLLLYLAGNTALLQAPALAVVGSRRPTAQGRDNARALSQALCAQGFTIVSGLAAGIDGAAHEGALQAVAQGAIASTIAVVGTGLDTVYPRAHAGLAARITAQGLMVSEMPLGAPPLAAHFPQRNRLIAGLARGTLVVEAALLSGSLITARMALEAGRDVLAVPGSIHSANARGCHALIRDGAALVEGADDVLAALGRPASQGELALSAPAGDEPLDPSAAAATSADDAVLQALGDDPVSLDALIARCGWPAPALSAHLLALELDGVVARLPGGLYQRRHPV
ncbi:MAG: DNA-protecting protein DprA [Burkholderiales bacterium PBB5]|nr:MAG: DNA-protecting protein DprA [Burkholderiales bacterium PBB5]